MHSCFRAASGFRNPWAPEIRQEAAGFPGGLQVPVKSYPRILSESSMMGCVSIWPVCGVSRPAGPGVWGHRLARSLTCICCSLLLLPGANSVPFFLCCLASPLSPVLSPCTWQGPWLAAPLLPPRYWHSSLPSQQDFADPCSSAGPLSAGLLPLLCFVWIHCTRPAALYFLCVPPLECNVAGSRGFLLLLAFESVPRTWCTLSA